MVEKINSAAKFVSGSYILRTKTGAYNSMIKVNLERMGVTSCMMGSSLAYTDLIAVKDLLEAYPTKNAGESKLPFFNLIKQESEPMPVSLMVPFYFSKFRNSPL